MANGSVFFQGKKDMTKSKEFIKRVTAPNGSVFTGSGTNSYLIGLEDITLVDPGPIIDEHIEKLIKLGEGKIKRILVTHTHRDHTAGFQQMIRHDFGYELEVWAHREAVDPAWLRFDVFRPIHATHYWEHGIRTDVEWSAGSIQLT